MAKLVYAMLGGREAGGGHLQGNGRAGLWREGLEDEAGESMVVTATTEEVPTTRQNIHTTPCLPRTTRRLGKAVTDISQLSKLRIREVRSLD